MKQLTIAYLRSNLANALRDLPFEIIDGRSKEVLARVIDASIGIDSVVGVPTDTPLQVTINTKKIKKDPLKEIKTKIKELPKKDGALYCEHGFPKQLCKKCMFK